MHPLDLNKVKCRISEGCFFAIASHARYKVVKVPQEDDCGTDYQLKRQVDRSGRICDMGAILDFQLKATAKWKLENNLFKYQLENKTLNDISTRNSAGGTPLVVVVMLLPKKSSDWIKFADDTITFKDNLYWYYSDHTTLAKNEASKTTIEISKANVLDVNALHYLVKNFSTSRVSL